MAYEIFTRVMPVRQTTPTVSINKLGRLGLNRATAEIMKKNAVEYVLLMWDKDRQKVALRPIGRKESRAYSVLYGRKDAFGVVTAKSFLDYIGYDKSETRTFPAMWNESENILEIDIPAQYFKKDKAQVVGTVAELKQKRG